MKAGQSDGGDDVRDVTDLITLSPLTLPAVLRCLRMRYEEGRYYTQAGSVLVALNPFTAVSHLYTRDVISRVHHVTSVEQLEPHVFSVAERAYTYLQRGLANQSVVVSGESGAGKTVSARHLLQYLVTVSQLDHPTSDKERGSLIERRILDSNPILEAFGNACTVRNENSSRFGKYIELHFDRSYRVVGARIRTFLLEKTRVVQQADNENNFHIFYQLLQGHRKHVETLCGPLLTRDLDTVFSLLDCSQRNKERDVESFKELTDAFADFSIAQSELGELYKVLVAMLLLSRLQFDSDDGADSCHFALHQQGVQERVCALLGTAPARLERTLTQRQITATHARRKSVFSKPCSVQQASLRRHCMVKLIYASLFDWLLNYINRHIEGPPAHASIGILDIYGFESFEKNSLEQLCINYANEQLQQHFVHNFLRTIQEEHVLEGVVWAETEFEDNQPCLQLLAATPGVFSVLNEECELNRESDDASLCARLVHSLGSHRRFQRCLRECAFTVLHYAHPVTYSCHRLAHKNKDNVPEEIGALLRESSTPFIARLASHSAHAGTPRGTTRRKTLLTKFKASLDGLMRTLQDTEVHYIRCLKPSALQPGGEWDDTAVLDQLRACGLVHTIAISRQAFPARIAYGDFVQRFGLLLRGDDKRPLVDISNTSACTHSDTPRPKKIPRYDTRETRREDNENTPPGRTNRQIKPLGTVCDGYSNRRLFEKQFDDSVFQSCDKDKTPGTEHGDGLEVGTPPPATDQTSDAMDDALWIDAECLTPRRRPVSERKRRRRAEFTSSAGHSPHLCAAIWAAVRARAGEPLRQPQYGKTKLFLTHQQVELLEREKARVLSAHAFSIQCAWRRYCRHQRLTAAVTIQSAIRTWLVRRRLVTQQHAAVTIQRAYRAYSRRAYMRRVRMRGMSAVVQHSPAGRGASKHCGVNTPRKIPPPTKPKPKRSARGKPTDFVERSSTPIQDSVSDSFIPIAISPITQQSHPLTVQAHRKVHMHPEIVHAYHRLAVVLSTAFAERRHVYLVNELVLAPYLEAYDGILSRRRMPRVAIRFHTRANSVLECGHYISQREFNCSISDCLRRYDQ